MQNRNGGLKGYSVQALCPFFLNKIFAFAKYLIKGIVAL